MKNTIIIFLLIAGLASQSLAQATADAPDTTRISCGARILGMGRAFVGLADDVNTIFLNPSGISDIDRWQVTSMSGKIIEANYLVFSGVYPTDFGNFGLGLSGASIGGVYATKVKDGTQGTFDELHEFDHTIPTMDYFNNVYLFSYGTRIGKVLAIPQLDLVKDLSVGASLKMFTAGLGGGNITNGSATGSELDMGLLGRATPWLGYGLNLSNVLPYSMGGKLVYAGSNHEESYPVNVRVGTAINLLGARDSLISHGHSVKLLLDMENYPTTPRFPWIMHLGAEWSPFPLISLRAGIDQDAAEDINGNIENISNLTAGVGLTYQMFRFDYAYHQFAGVTGADNHFFSFTYGLPLAKEEKLDYLKVDRPQDKTITTEARTEVAGRVEPQVKYVTVNDLFATMARDLTFSKQLELKPAKNRITVGALDISRKLLDSETLRMLRLRTFPDVEKGRWSFEQIGYIATLGIIEGYPSGLFIPHGNITRAELTTVLMRTGKVTPEAEVSYFSDVKITNWAAKYIMPAVKLSVVKGYPDGTFRPQANITRAEGLAMIARFSRITPEAGTTPYADVMASHWAAPIIKGSYRAGMLKFLGQAAFEPNRKLTREEAVEMLYRSPYVQGLLKSDLLNWETY